MVQTGSTNSLKKFQITHRLPAEKIKGSWELDLSTHQLFWDDSQYKVYGFMPGEIVINDDYFIKNTTHFSDVKRVTKIIEGALKNAEEYNFRRRIVKKCGNLGFAETQARIIRGTNGLPKTIIGNTIDISVLGGDQIHDFNDPLFFDDMYSKYKKVIAFEIFTITNDSDLTKDLCQEVFLKAWHNMCLYNPEKGKLYTWLKNIAANHCKDYFSSKYYRCHKITSSLEKAKHQQADDSDVDTSTFVKELLIQLPIDQREFIELLFVQGFSQPEVARIKKLPLGTVKSNSRRAIKTLRKLAGIIENNPTKIIHPINQ